MHVCVPVWHCPTLLPQIRFYGPAVTVCQIPQLWLQFVPDVLDAPDPTGFSERGIVETTDDTQNDDPLEFDALLHPTNSVLGDTWAASVRT